MVAAGWRLSGASDHLVSEALYLSDPERNGIELPLVDLFRWGAEGQIAPIMTSAIDIGASEVDGVSCEHYAIRQDGLDWQVWVQQGAYPLPRKLVLTTLTDEARPQHSVVLTWNLAPSFNDETFVFTPPASARRVALAEIPGRRPGVKKVSSR